MSQAIDHRLEAHRLEAMGALVERHCHAPHQLTPIPGLTLFRIEEASPPHHLLYNPRLLVVLRGSKAVILGGAPFQIDPATFLLVSADLPVCTNVRPGADGRSHLALTLDIDRLLLADVLQKLPGWSAPAATPSAGVVSAPMDQALLAPLERLLQLLDTPREAAFLQPLILQEIYFRLFQGGLGGTLAPLVMLGSHLNQIARATDWIKAHYREPMSIEALAEIAGMSVTSFHRHFKAVTLMTPLQYRTQIRLQEARRILLAERQTAGSAGLMVGYDSQSQFSRDYRRMFGAPPAADTARLVGAAEDF